MPLPEQPLMPANVKPSNSSRAMVMRRRRGTKKNNMQANAPPPTIRVRPACTETVLCDSCAAIVVRVTVDVAVPPDASVKLSGEATQVGRSEAVPTPLNATEQVTATVPAKPPLELTVMVLAPLLPGEAMVTAVALRIGTDTALVIVTVLEVAVAKVESPNFPVMVCEPAVKV